MRRSRFIREHLLSGENDYERGQERFGSDIQSFLATDVYLGIEKDEAERRDADSLKPVL